MRVRTATSCTEMRLLEASLYAHPYAHRPPSVPMGSVSGQRERQPTASDLGRPQPAQGAISVPSRHRSPLGSRSFDRHGEGFNYSPASAVKAKLSHRVSQELVLRSKLVV